MPIIFVGTIILGGFIFFIILIYYPVYLLRFFKHRRLAKKIDKSLAPSWLPSIFCLLVLAMIAFVVILPKYSYIPHDLSMEARINLGEIKTNQTAYLGESGVYADGPNAFDLLAWNPGDHNYYAYFVGDDIIPNVRGHEIIYQPDGDWPFSIRPGSSDKGFTAMAVGNIDNDDCLDVWIMNDARILTWIVRDRENTFKKGYCIDCPWAKQQSWLNRFFEDIITEDIAETIVLLNFIGIFLLPLISLIKILRDRKKFALLREMEKEIKNVREPA